MHAPSCFPSIHNAANSESRSNPLRNSYRSVLTTVIAIISQQATATLKTLGFKLSELTYPITIPSKYSLTLAIKIS